MSAIDNLPPDLTVRRSEFHECASSIYISATATGNDQSGTEKVAVRERSIVVEAEKGVYGSAGLLPIGAAGRRRARAGKGEFDG